MNTFLFKAVPHKEAIAFLKDKAPVTRAVFDKMLPELRGRAFTASLLETTGSVQRVRDLVAELPAGGDWDTLKKEIADEFSPHFVDPAADAATQAKQIAASEARAELILRTNGYDAYDATHTAALKEEGDVFTYWQWQTVGDELVRPSHAALDGKVFPADSEFWNRQKEWGCRCTKVGLMEDDAREMREADADLPPGDRRVLEGGQLEAAEKGVLNIGPQTAADVRPGALDWEEVATEGKGGTATIDLNKGARFRTTRLNDDGLRVPLEDLRGRYDEKTFAEFEAMAKKTQIADGRSLWDWLAGPNFGGSPA